MVNRNQGLFHLVEDAYAILVSRGVYKQAKVYQRNGHLFAAHGSGFIRLTQNGTSHPNVRIDSIEAEFEPAVTDHGRLLLSAPK